MAGRESKVLVVGAGPAGLALALNLVRRKVPVRVISGATGPGETSRAMAMLARTLELYDHFGLAEAMVDAGVKIEAVHLRNPGSGGEREVVNLPLGQIGDGLTPYPFVLAYPQDAQERLLVGALAADGFRVDWDTRLESFSQDADGVRAKLSLPDRTNEDVSALWLCGCDGAHSAVRHGLGVGFPGGTYDLLFYVADVKIAGGFQRDFYLNLGPDIVALMLPVRSDGTQRLIGLVPRRLVDKADVAFEDIRADVEPLLGVKVESVNWFSTYRVHHRVAERFRVGRAFLLGDAAHIHSPVGGQGMNTGVGDAMNLGWKLAQALDGKASPSLLDSYEDERIAFARRLVRTTDRLFTAAVASGRAGALARRFVLPTLVRLGTEIGAGRRLFFRTLSQLALRYPESPISEGSAGRVRGGDRLPWTGQGGPDNYAPLRSLGWQVHVYGDPSIHLREQVKLARLTLHLFPWGEAVEAAGLMRGAAYFVRPDGYVGFAAPPDAAPVALRAYAEGMGLW
jgi:2-polyprenyl-6-methoxyphenol hydroxylase-like FAD-dependent oxidoreductase